MKEKRYYLVDSIRGFALVSMILYHTVYDLVYIYDFNILWFKKTEGYIWQQSICYIFIFISGMSYHYSKNAIRRGFITLGLGTLISIISMIFMPSEKIIWGILSFIGISTILVKVLLDKYLKKVKPLTGIFMSIFLFVCTKNINYRYLGFENFNIVKIPNIFYRIKGLNLIGFTNENFRSSDYFSIIPWIFLYICGYYFLNFIKENNLNSYLEYRIYGFNKIGEKSLIIYMLHQPIILAILYIFLK